MAKKSKQRKSKKYNHRSSMDKTIQKSLKGFFIKWSDEDPLENIREPTKVQVGSTNPVVKLRLINDGFWDCMRHVLHARKCKWRIICEMDFEKGGKIETKSREIVGIAALPDLDEVYQDTLEAMFDDAVTKRYIDQYVITRIHQEILSGDVIKDCDFSE